MIISEEKGWITGVQFLSMNNVLEIQAEFPRLEYDMGSMQIRADTVCNTFPFNMNVPKSFDPAILRNKKVRVTVELIENGEG